MSGRLAPLAVAALVCLAVPAASRAATDVDKAAALAAVREGNRLLDDKQPAKALERFLEAQRLVGGDKVRFNLGQALAALPGREADAYREMTLFLERVPNAAPELARVARAEVERLRARIGLVRFYVQPDGAAVAVDGEARGTAPLAAAVPVAPGPHELRVTADGFSPYQAHVTVAAGEDLAETVALTKVPAPVPAPPAPAVAIAAPPPAVLSPPPAAAPAVIVAVPSPAPAAQEPVYKKWWLWTGVAAVVGAGIVTAILISRGGGVEHACPPEVARCQPVP